MFDYSWFQVHLDFEQWNLETLILKLNLVLGQKVNSKHHMNILSSMKQTQTAKFKLLILKISSKQCCNQTNIYLVYNYDWIPKDMDEY